MTIVTNKWPPMALGKKATQNEEIGFADLPQTIAGNAATIKGHTAGGETVVDASNPAPLNPSGDFGHDHSGGAFGRPIYHSIVTYTFDDTGWYNSDEARLKIPGLPDTASIISNAVNQNNADRVAPYRLTSEQGIDGETISTYDFVDFAIWVPPCDLQRGAYLNCNVNALVYFRSNPGTPAMVSTDVVSLYLLNLHPQASFRDQQNPSIAGFAYAAEAQAEPLAPIPQDDGFYHMFSGGNMLLFPGQINPLRAKAKAVLGAGGPANRAFQMYLLDMEFGVFDASTS